MLFKNLFYFYFNPSKDDGVILQLRSKISSALIFLLLNYLFICFFFTVLYLLPTNILPNLVYTLSAEKQNHTFFYPVLLCPLIEEIVFRLWVVYSKIKLSLSAAILLPFIIFYLSRYVLISDLYLASITVSLCTIFPLIFFLLKSYETQKLIFFWQNNKKKFIVNSSFVFGFMHIGNYVITTKTILYFPILFLPEFFAGFTLSYIRIRMGFVIGVAWHCLYNFIPYLLYIFF